MIKAGRLNRRIIIQRATTANNSMNEKVPSWAALKTVWAEVKPAPATESMANGETVAHATTAFLIRYAPTLADVNAKDRIIYGGRTYDIQGAVDAADHDRRLRPREGILITATNRGD